MRRPKQPDPTVDLRDRARAEGKSLLEVKLTPPGSRRVQVVIVIPSIRPHLEPALRAEAIREALDEAAEALIDLADQQSAEWDDVMSEPPPNREKRRNRPRVRGIER